ncbi:hypothetical protein L1987_61377 [Smallanthus sonchifolius]|uniref:Uncharacterized protein n=1 Tax=Smallanthus sonchifolius TaxID=185202 RepID=A0ACB9C7G2_9ASTR|nr:hypothetical protein L1987_61377 [Smallanthus sonchifolius]
MVGLLAGKAAHLACAVSTHWDKEAKFLLTWLAKNLAIGMIQQKLYRRDWNILRMVLNNEDPPDQVTCVGLKCWNWKIDASSLALMILTYEDKAKEYTNSKGMHTAKRTGNSSYMPNGYGSSGNEITSILGDNFKAGQMRILSYLFMLIWNYIIESHVYGGMGWDLFRCCRVGEDHVRLDPVRGFPDDLEATEEGEMEVCSGQNENSNQLVTAETMKSGSFTPTILANTNSKYQTGGVSEWDRMNKDQVVIRWPERWDSNIDVDLRSKWDVTIHAVKNAWMEEFAEGMSDLHQSSIFTKNTSLPGSDIQFFKQLDTMVDCLAKWEGSHKLSDREAWRKETGKRRVLPNWLDIERATCNPDEALHSKRKKKRKSKGRNPFKNQKIGLLGNNDTEPRRKIKVKSSKTKNLLKSLSQEAVIFSNSGDIPKVNPPPMGFGAFRVGKDSIVATGSKPKVSHASKLDKLYEELVAREVKLKEIAGNVLKTDANRVLLNSILSMKSCKIKKFSAQVDAQGMVTIDENMVDKEQDSEETFQTRTTTPKPSYAQRLTGISGTTLEGPIQPRSSEERERDTTTPSNKNTNVGVATAGTVDNEGDGFTLVRNRKSGSRQTNSGQWNNPRQFTNNSWHRRNVAGTQPVSRNRQNGTGNMNNYERNIVSNHSGVNVHADMGMDRAGGEQVGQSKDSNHTTQRVVNKPVPTDVMQGLQGKGKSVRTPDVQMVETSNRFLLLDVDGNEMENNIEGMEDKDQNVHQPEERNAGWIKKQERTLNKDYSNKDNGTETNDIDIANEVENMEEVESETDATTMLMTADGPILPNAYGPTVSTENSEEQEQPLVDMLRDGSTKPVC